MQFFKIVLISVLFAVAYGIAHDLVTIHISPEYFTVIHPPVFETGSKLVLGAAWGGVASALLAVPMGFILASASTNGTKFPPIATRTVVGFLCRLLAFVVATAGFSGTLAFALARTGWLLGPQGLSDRVPEYSHARLIAVQWSHAGAYLAGIVGTGIIALLILRTRKRMKENGP